jgi:ketosteroid isomerase-like protein
MTRKSILVLLIASFSFLTAERDLIAQNGTAQPDPKVEIRRLIDTYMQSVDEADAKLGATVWLPTPDATFIEPTGHERGWDEISAVVYGKLMGQTFSKRLLKMVGEATIHVYGDAAVAEFDWDFVATMRSDGSAVHTTGRESQVYINLPGKGWRLVHVHYSGPPVSAPGKGF